MRIYFLGICGTFMASLAILAREMGHTVGGCDQNVYPPMSTLLEDQGIQIDKEYLAEHIPQDSDLIVIGNALSRGNACVEHVLNEKLPYTSSPQWLGDQLLRKRNTIAISGTHGKTTTTSITSWLLDNAGVDCGYLVGGSPKNFPVSARLGSAQAFVIEADEYDSAFFDKRSKFLHYHSDTLVINNIEFDHADIFADIEAIKQQFRFLLRTVPANGTVIHNLDEPLVSDVLAMGCWSQTLSYSLVDSSADWYAHTNEDGSHCVYRHKELLGKFSWPLSGRHNLYNALAAIAAATLNGASPRDCLQALATFSGVARRQELLYSSQDLVIYEDFAHHPTAIKTTLAGLREKHPDSRLVLVLEPRSNTMRAGVHAARLPDATSLADTVFVYSNERLAWEWPGLCMFSDAEQLMEAVHNELTADTCLVFMSNGSFDAIPRNFVHSLSQSS